MAGKGNVYGYVHPACGEVAFYLNANRKPEAHEVLRSQSATFPDGKTPEPSTGVVCGHCGGDVYNGELTVDSIVLIHEGA